MNIRLILEFVAGIALVGGLLWYNHHERQIGAQQCLATQKKQAQKDADQGKRAVEDALAKAATQAKAEEETRQANAEIERQKLIKDVADAHLKASDLQRRYESQLATDKTCATWNQEKVACALQ